MDIEMSGSPPSDFAKEPRALGSLLGRTDRADGFGLNDPRCDPLEEAA